LSDMRAHVQSYSKDVAVEVRRLIGYGRNVNRPSITAVVAQVGTARIAGIVGAFIGLLNVVLTVGGVVVWPGVGWDRAHGSRRLVR
jgi:hypothetical protein